MAPNLKTKSCEKTIKNSKYENTNTQKNAKWWLNAFEILEKDIKTPDEHKYSFLKHLLPPIILNKVMRTRDIPLIEETTDDMKTAETIKSDIDDTVESLFQTVRTEEEKDLCMQFEKLLGIVHKKKNVYVDFFKRKPGRAAIWRDLPPLEWREMKLSEMAEAVTQAIATDFVNWLDSMGGTVGEGLNVESIKDMFQVGSSAYGAGTVCVEVKELSAVTQKQADSVGLPELSRKNFLRDQIRKDQKASSMKPKISAFGTQLPSYMQIKPPPKDFYKKWLRCEKIPPKLESMATVWEGITHLRSTRMFCEHLYRECPNIKAPRYLYETGLMNPKVFTKYYTDAEMNALELQKIA
ncbi:unnamed protein product [Psylliodes chrysocephalus]|uniref:Uncharacterized protein n=1 Tax=Psylliodes chrysocephalus TaxID=3402493 RepID=A0A9P0CZR7_9CUCU|nr:unnamed protein product [Psylliodes chrysocephala]